MCIYLYLYLSLCHRSSYLNVDFFFYLDLFFSFASDRYMCELDERLAYIRLYLLEGEKTLEVIMTVNFIEEKYAFLKQRKILFI